MHCRLLKFINVTWINWFFQKWKETRRNGNITAKLKRRSASTQSQISSASVTSILEFADIVTKSSRWMRTAPSNNGIFWLCGILCFDFFLFRSDFYCKDCYKVIKKMYFKINKSLNAKRLKKNAAHRAARVDEANRGQRKKKEIECPRLDRFYY